MIVGSINTKKRLGAVGARERFESWLKRREVTLVVVQEAWRAGGPGPPRRRGCRFWMEMPRSRRGAVTDRSTARRPPRRVVADCVGRWPRDPFGPPRSLQRREAGSAQLQILAERLPTVTTSFSATSISPLAWVSARLSRPADHGRPRGAARRGAGGRLHRSAWHARRRGLPVRARAAWSEPEGWRSVFASPNG